MASLVLFAVLYVCAVITTHLSYLISSFNDPASYLWYVMIYGAVLFLYCWVTLFFNYPYGFLFTQPLFYLTTGLCVCYLFYTGSLLILGENSGVVLSHY